jgi:hypothetical protein
MLEYESGTCLPPLIHVSYAIPGYLVKVSDGEKVTEVKVPPLPWMPYLFKRSSACSPGSSGAPVFIGNVLVGIHCAEGTPDCAEGTAICFNPTVNELLRALAPAVATLECIQVECIGMILVV